MNKNPQLFSSSNLNSAGIQNSLNKLQQLQAKMQNAEEIKVYIRQRKEQIKQYLMQYAHLPSGISNIYKEYNKDLYYYNQQLTECKEILNDPDKIINKALQFLRNVPAFAGFMKKYSFLTGLFDIPGDYGNAQSMLGLQTRDQVMTGIQSQLSSGGPNAMAVFSQNLQAAQHQLQQLKSRLTSLGSGGENIDVPNFKPNGQKTKKLLSRLELGTNIQTNHGTNYFPVTSDIGLSVGYKLNDKNRIGIGMSYKMGWGKNISNINVTSQGMGMRSFVDINMKGSFYISGGFEYNHQQPFDSTGHVNSPKYWQESGLVGISKVISVKTKFFKKSKLQLLWDFLSYQQIPRGAPLKFRIGYNF